MVKNQKRVGESDVKERLRLNLCVWCGKKRHEGKEKCPERKPRTSPQAEGESKSADRPMCKGCGKPGHTEDKCWSLHPELKPQKK